MTLPEPEPLVRPWGIQFPQERDCPPDEYKKIRAMIETANITTGYVRLEGHEQYSARFEINAHAFNLFSLFRDLVQALLPAAAAMIVGTKDQQTIVGPYTDREFALGIFETHSEVLVYDGFLEFGMISLHDERLEEVFLTPYKYLQVWTNRPESVEEVLSRHALPFVPGLQFVDDYPSVSHSQPDKHGNPQWQSVYHSITNAFENLPVLGPGYELSDMDAAGDN